MSLSMRARRATGRAAQQTRDDYAELNGGLDADRGPVTYHVVPFSKERIETETSPMTCFECAKEYPITRPAGRHFWLAVCPGCGHDAAFFVNNIKLEMENHEPK